MPDFASATTPDALADAELKLTASMLVRSGSREDQVAHLQQPLADRCRQSAEGTVQFARQRWRSHGGLRSQRKGNTPAL